ncbi:MAG: bifunctional oligoribonuclease/PAP phosphatase NrnA [Clostridia bacterium]|nr:bifunctional oligoribonuclease/PAP phosphatase NrnA [Clostridia bacterium]
MEKIDVKAAAKLLEDKDKITILTHISPDGDTIGSSYALCFALRKLGKRAKVECADEIPSKYSFLNYIDDDFIPEYIVAVDVAAFELLGSLWDKYKKVDLCIDHHIKNKQYSDFLCLYPKAAATCEIIFDLIENLGENLVDEKIATSLYLGISTDSGCFRYSNVTSDTHYKAAKLIDLGAKSDRVNKIFFRTKSFSMLTLLGESLRTSKKYLNDRVLFVKITREMIEDAKASYENCGEIVAIVSQLEGFDICLVAKQRESTFKYSIRTDGDFDASFIAEKFDGGGHKNAAAFESGKPTEETLTKFLEICEILIKEND